MAGPRSPWLSFSWNNDHIFLIHTEPKKRYSQRSEATVMFNFFEWYRCYCWYTFFVEELRYMNSYTANSFVTFRKTQILDYYYYYYCHHYPPNHHSKTTAYLFQICGCDWTSTKQAYRSCLGGHLPKVHTHTHHHHHHTWLFCTTSLVEAAHRHISFTIINWPRLRVYSLASKCNDDYFKADW